MALIENKSYERLGRFEIPGDKETIGGKLSKIQKQELIKALQGVDIHDKDSNNDQKDTDGKGFYDKLQANPKYSFGNERSLYRLSDRGGRVGAAYYEQSSNPGGSEKEIVDQSVAVIEHVKPDSPQVADCIQKSKKYIDDFCNNLGIDKQTHEEDYLSIILYFNNKAINEVWPNQDDNRRKNLINNAIENKDGILEQSDSENEGAMVCVNKAACQHFLLNEYGISDVYLQEIKNYGGSNDGHMNNVVNTPSNAIQEINAGENPDRVLDNNKIKMIELLNTLSQN